MSDLRGRVGAVPTDWKVGRFCEALTASRSAVVVNKRDHYREIGIRSHGKGIFHKEPVSGSDLGDKRVFWVEPERLVFNIVFAWERAVAVTSAAEEGMIASHRFPMFRPAYDGAVDVEFLRRFFLTDRGAQLLADASPGGAGRNRTLNQKFLADTPVPLPPLLEQRKIAAILSSVDEVIEKTEAVIEQLRVVKKAMMQELLTRGLPGRHTRFTTGALGQLPETWNVVTLDAVLDGVDAGWSPKCGSAPAGPDAWGVLKISAVTWGRFNENENKALPADLEPRPGIEVHPGDVIVSRANTLELVGRAVLVTKTRPRLMLSDKLLRLRALGRLLPGFLNLVLATPFARLWIQDGATGTSQSMKNISQAKLLAMPVPVPPKDEQAQIVASIDALDARLGDEQATRDALQHVKASLLSVLLTGELRVTTDEDAA